MKILAVYRYAPKGVFVLAFAGGLSALGGILVQLVTPYRSDGMDAVIADILCYGVAAFFGLYALGALVENVCRYIAKEPLLPPGAYGGEIESPRNVWQMASILFWISVQAGFAFGFIMLGKVL
ncbi:hypothetical protein [Salipiger mucosus]|uniref:Uncharacterized protein n=1 Tax=Salipiger mucosus DSM 16094 TaxID=1123237 RepID=S9S3J1_9RHOB|nr:hypothetical protein [Salipiger mucosus]EPX84765.1 hypothetical protein Salmuc_01338 [Salipiger mucosus DSM 16094]